MTWALARRASTTTCSQPSGLRLCGIVLLPICCCVQPTSTSPISQRFKVRISSATRASEAVTMASVLTNSVTRSRDTCQPASGTSSDSRWANFSSMAMASLPKAAIVPTPPNSWTTRIRLRASPRRSRWRKSSSIQPATFSAKVVGKAGIEWVLATMRLLRCPSASTASLASSASSACSIASSTSRISNDWAVSWMSWVVAPKCTYSRALGLQFFCNAPSSGISECPVLATPSAIWCRSTAESCAAFSISSAASRGIIPTSA
ncbi:hypothetical protein D3C78_600650 [compost metagenome]